jgi:uncharacterized membrane protein
MLERRSDRIQLALIVAMAVVGLWVVLILPSDARVPIHFDANGRPNGWAGPVVALFMMPALAALLWGLMAVLPKIDPRGDNLRRSAGAVNAIGLATTALLGVVQAVIVVAALGLPAPKSSLGLLLVGGLYVVIGNVMGKLRPNHTVGIRTPWTLANERVWDQTHRFGGKAFVLGGVLLWGLVAVPMDTQWQGPAIVVVALAITAASTLKSYLLWRALQRPTR